MSPRIQRLLCAIGLSLTAALTACTGSGPAPEPAAPNLWGSTWRLADIDGQAALAAPVATLGFPEPGRVNGVGSCNRFSGTVQVNENRLSFGPLMSTKMACAGGASAQEFRYLSALQKAERYEIRDNMLYLHVPGMAQPLTFRRIKGS